MKRQVKASQNPGDFKRFSFISEYDFSLSKVHLVTSIPGVFRNAEMEKYGHMKVRKIFSKMDLDVPEESVLIAQMSSFGSLSDSWISQFLRSFAFSKFSQNQKSENQKSQSQKTKKSSQNTQNNQLKLIWPSRTFVKTCIDGTSAGYSLLLFEKNYKDCIKDRLYEYRDENRTSKLIPPHIKVSLEMIGFANEDFLFELLLRTRD